MSDICAFFGHRDTLVTSELERHLEQTIRRLINEGIEEFWFGNEGTFDWLVQFVLLRIKKDYPYIYICYISAYNPDNFSQTKKNWLEQHFEIIYPPEIAATFPRLAITHRNNYIADNVQVIICYIKTHKGGAYNAIKRAHKNGAKIINLAL